MGALAANPLDVAFIDAARLGHKMSTWSVITSTGKLFSYCASCDDYLEAWPTKVFGKSQVSGAAVVLRCNGVECKHRWSHVIPCAPCNSGLGKAPCEYKCYQCGASKQVDRA